MITPTADGGNPAASTPSSIAGEIVLASPTTATSATTSSATLVSASRSDGGGACSSSPPASPDGQEVVAVAHGLDDDEQAVERRSTRRAANTSWAVENSGPGALVVNVGSTRQTVASVATAASALPDPSALKSATWRRSAPTSTDTPMIPLRVIITAAKTVSRASVAVSSGSPDDHQGDDQRDLDDRDGHGQHQRPERLADAVRHHLRVVHGREHGAGEDRPHDDHGRPAEVAAPGQRPARRTAPSGTTVVRARPQSRT